jgi:hypothetical protein
MKFGTVKGTKNLEKRHYISIKEERLWQAVSATVVLILPRISVFIACFILSDGGRAERKTSFRTLRKWAHSNFKYFKIQGFVNSSSEGVYSWRG